MNHPGLKYLIDGEPPAPKHTAAAWRYFDDVLAAQYRQASLNDLLRQYTHWTNLYSGTIRYYESGTTS